MADFVNQVKNKIILWKNFYREYMVKERKAKKLSLS